MAEIILKRGQLDPPGPMIPHLTTSAKHRIVISWFRRATLVEFEDTLFRTDSAVMMPTAEKPSSAEEGEDRRVSAVGLIAACLRFCQEHPGLKILVAGHTDTTGDDAHNLELSGFRAQCVHSVLVGDSKTFAKICSDWRRMKVADYEQILEWLDETRGFDCDPGTIDGQHTNQTQTAVTNFRKAYNEVGPGATRAPKVTVFGPANNLETWEAYFHCYEDALMEELGEDIAGLAELRAGLDFLVADHFVGCGEAHPIEAEDVDEFRSQTNRRVEVVYFEPGEEPKMDCHPGPGQCDPDACELYVREKFRRRVLPPMVSARRWTASWEDSHTHMGEVRDMVVDAPGLPAGIEMTFVVTLVGFGVIAELTVASQTDTVACPFDQWEQPDAVQPVGELEPGQAFPASDYTFVVTGGGRRVESVAPIRYGDRAHLALQLDDGTPFANERYRVVTPWGSRHGVTDENGVMDETDLPPGGVSVLLRDNTLVHTGELPDDWEGDP